MKRPLFFPVCFGILALTFPLPARTFTAQDGRKLEGEIVAVNGREVSVRRASDGRVVKIMADTLIEADQQVIIAWRPATTAAAAPVSKITISAVKDKVTSITRSSGGNSSAADSKDQSWRWIITIKNPTAQPIAAGLTLNYAQIVERTDRNQAGVSGRAKTPVRASRGQETLPEIPAFKSIQVMTGPIAVQAMRTTDVRQSSTTSGDTVTEVTMRKWDEALSGLKVDLLSGGQPVKNWKTGSDTEAAVPGAGR